tara:strand:- start:768 stop:1094 length:327 start_codon:yes stop_codon:yes gene_type:complete
MNTVLKKYHLILLVSLLVVMLYSCKKGEMPVPSIDQLEFVTGDGADDSSVKGGSSNDKGDVVGGDDNEDDDGGGVSDDGNDGDDGTQGMGVKGDGDIDGGVGSTSISG